MDELDSQSPRGRAMAFCQQYGLRIPILQAPMAGSCPGRPGKNGGYPNFASDVSCVPGCRGDSVARHSSFKTWSRLGVGDRLRGSHLDQDQVSLSSQRVFEKSLMSEQGG